MLIDLILEKDIWLTQFDQEAVDQNKVKVEKDDTCFILFADINGKCEFIHGFERIQEGVYWTDLNPQLYLYSAYGRNNVISSLYAYIEYKNCDYHGLYEFYGVGDSPDQILSHPNIIKQFIRPTEDKFILALTPIRKANQPEMGGWRWHKWGEYIGEQHPQCEYLYNEPKIEEIIVYHFYLLRDEK